MNTTTMNTNNLAPKFEAIVHDARLLTSLLQRLAGRYLAADDADMHEALNLAGLIAGTASAGMAAQPEQVTAAQLAEHVAAIVGTCCRPGLTNEHIQADPNSRRQDRDQ